MSSWTCVTFLPADRSPEAVADDLRDEITGADEQICRDEEQSDPNIRCRDQRVIWYVHGLSNEAFDLLSVPCKKALAIHMNDTSEGGYGDLYEWVGGRFVQTDRFPDDTFGRTLQNYFALEHDILGEIRV